MSRTPRTRPGGTGAACRAQAATVVAAVVSQGRSLSEALPPALAQLPARDGGLLQELCYGTVRWQIPLDYLVNRLLRQPLPAHAVTLRALLLVGLYQLFYLRIPGYAAVAATVAATAAIGQPRARGLVNAVLRNSQRQREALQQELAADPTLTSAHPAWLLAAIRSAWPAHWTAIVAANNRRPPMALRVNLSRISRSDYLERLTTAAIAAKPDVLVASAVVLADPCGVESLPGFADGLVSVQDPAAQLAAELLAAERGQRVLDACAAPGGKTGHLLERTPDLELVALDQDRQRLARVADNLQRLGLHATLQPGDASAPEQWWDHRPFDRILLDAPCSGSGVIRRHPDIKLLRRATDIADLAQRQQRMLNALWPLLRAGGRLLYATCSLLPDETQTVIDAFLAGHDDAEPLPIGPGHPAGSGRQLLPGDDSHDGFFYACLSKRTAV